MVPKVTKVVTLSSYWGYFSRRSSCKQLADAIRKLRSIACPIGDTVTLQVYGRGIGAGIIGANNFNRTTVACAVLLDNNDAVVGLLTRSNARQTDHQHWECLSKHG